MVGQPCPQLRAQNQTNIGRWNEHTLCFFLIIISLSLNCSSLRAFSCSSLEGWTSALPTWTPILGFSFSTSSSPSETSSSPSSLSSLKNWISDKESFNVGFCHEGKNEKNVFVLPWRSIFAQGCFKHSPLLSLRRTKFPYNFENSMTLLRQRFPEN